MIVRLRWLVPEDGRAVHTLLSDMEIIRHMLFPLHDEQQARDFVAQAAAAASSPAAWNKVWGICAGDGLDLVGLCGLVVEPIREDAEAWYLIGKSHWGKGIATEALRLLLETGFGRLSLHRIWACTVPENPASTRVLEKAGFRLEGKSLKNLKIHGTWRDTLQYAMLTEEWRGRRPAAN